MFLMFDLNVAVQAIFGIIGSEEKCNTGNQ